MQCVVCSVFVSSVLQRVAVCCSVLQCGAVILVFIMVIYYIIEEVVHVLQCGAVCCRVVQCVDLR